MAIVGRYEEEIYPWSLNSLVEQYIEVYPVPSPGMWLYISVWHY